MVDSTKAVLIVSPLQPPLAEIEMNSQLLRM